MQAGDELYGIDWKQVEEWCPVHDEEALVAESSDHHSAKMSEIERWVENKVFEVIEDNGQKTIDTTLVQFILGQINSNRNMQGTPIF